MAGGLGTRLYPLTHATNKHLLPVFDKPMIFYPIQTLVNAGIRDILVVVGGPHAGDFIRVLQNGKEFGIDHLEFAYQQSGDGGIADALKLAEDFSDNGPITVILGDNCTDADISKEVKNFKDGALIFLKKVHDPHRFGIAEIDPADKTKVFAIVEKPQKPKSNLAVTGVYIYDSQLEITDVNNIYIKEGNLRWATLDGYWSDAGTFETLFEVNKYWAEKSGIS
ncbi:MAG: Nucleotidyl transferase [Candidatus Curtissbacteria bacterium GW2011_GWA1_40_24]|uniref:glucose-1-phosphate thymidylyltransferase n=1 Tax=Candidatus Curtissbacteria bacterium GW2011_GWA1_40_24 TaxID=1618406 RepID=A0A0G0RXA1_9BACT|nr:MAG: Nucleotidyl transferase [Candidatus Curtissbacteria bacterium GW2011_GWA1_40_24]